MVVLKRRRNSLFVARPTTAGRIGPSQPVVTVVYALFCLPIADKLHVKLVDEEINRSLIIDGVLMMRESKSPALVREMLLTYLPEKHRDHGELAAAA